MLPVRIRKIPGKWWVHGCERCAERESNQQAGEIVGQREADAFEEDAFVHIHISWAGGFLTDGGCIDGKEMQHANHTSMCTPTAAHMHMYSCIRCLPEPPAAISGEKAYTGESIIGAKMAVRTIAAMCDSPLDSL